MQPPATPHPTARSGESEACRRPLGLFRRRLDAQEHADQPGLAAHPGLVEDALQLGAQRVDADPEQPGGGGEIVPSTMAGEPHLRRREPVDSPSPRRCGARSSRRRRRTPAPCRPRAAPSSGAAPPPRPRRARPPKPASARHSAGAGSATRGTPGARPRASAASRSRCRARRRPAAATSPAWPRSRSRASRFVQRIRASASTSISGHLASSTVLSIITMQAIFQAPSIRWRIRSCALAVLAGIAADLVEGHPGHVPVDDDVYLLPADAPVEVVLLREPRHDLLGCARRSRPSLRPPGRRAEAKASMPPGLRRLHPMARQASKSRWSHASVSARITARTAASSVPLPSMPRPPTTPVASIAHPASRGSSAQAWTTPTTSRISPAAVAIEPEQAEARAGQDDLIAVVPFLGPGIEGRGMARASMCAATRLSMCMGAFLLRSFLRRISHTLRPRPVMRADDIRPER